MDYLKRTWAEINLNNLKSNIDNYKKYLTPENKLMCVVKANCYGHGDTAVVPYLEKELGVKWFAVSNIYEAIHLRDIGIKGEILILGYTPIDKTKEISEYNIIQTIVEKSHAESLSKKAKSENVKIRVHISIDTGMTRIGLNTYDIDRACEEIKEINSLDNLSVEGIFTHFAVADSDDEDNIKYTDNQSKKIIKITHKLKSDGIDLKESHFLNSAGGVCHTSSESTLARLGIILYGLTPDVSLKLPFKPKPVMTLKSVVIMVKEVKEDVCISYGRTFKTEKPMKIATIACGYADGFPRFLSNKGSAIINGQKAKIVGRVCMDQFMCDVSDIKNINVEDTAILIGSDNGEEITADEIATIGSTIGYEVVCNVSKRVPRVIIKDGKEIDILK